jgi:hypothetical protein
MRFIKLGKTAWVILGIGIFVIAFVSLYMVYSRQDNEQEQLNDSLSAAQATLLTLVSEKEDWESQLTQWESQLTQLGSSLTETEDKLAQAASLLSRTAASLPESVESIEYDQELFRIADNWNLEITILTASEPSDNKVEVEVEDIKVEDITYSVTSFTVDVKGEVAGILGFIGAIVTSEDFLNATVELVKINIPEPLTEEEKEAIEEKLTNEIMEEFRELQLRELEGEEITEEEREELLEALAAALAAAEEEIEELEMPSASIRLVIYSYKGE